MKGGPDREDARSSGGAAYANPVTGDSLLRRDGFGGFSLL